MGKTSIKVAGFAVDQVTVRYIAGDSRGSF